MWFCTSCVCECMFCVQAVTMEMHIRRVVARNLYEVLGNLCVNRKFA